MNCICNLFDSDNMWWIIILILLLLYCNAGSCGCGCNHTCDCDQPRCGRCY